MNKITTKAAAEAVLSELPSVLGASVREDVNGHPREVHLLVAPGPDTRHLARDVRDLLQERLGIPVDQRVISIAQLAEPLDALPAEVAPPPAVETKAGERFAAALRDAANAPAPGAPVASPAAEPRLIYQGIESSTRDGRIQVRVRLSWQGEEYVGEGGELDGGQGRIRAAAAATLRAATAACGERIRLDVESTSTTRALGREYVLVSAVASSPLIGRRPVSLVGAQPLDFDVETAAALAALHATNRILGLALGA
jgi:hypothetical protein